jgi:predicted metal-dependent phosphoesterase TrpH
MMAARLGQRGIRVDVEPLIAQAEQSGQSLGRPDLARLMVAAGAVKTVKDAFTRHLYDGGPVDVPHHALALPDALALGRAAGAAMSLAHPHLYDQLGVALLRKHQRDGLAGVEALYAVYDPYERKRWIDLADELGLVCTAGSDFHSPDDASVPMGVDVDGDRGKRLYEWLFL